MEQNNGAWLEMHHSLKGPDFRWQLADRFRTLSRKNELWTWLDKPTQQAIKCLREMRRDERGTGRAIERFPVVAAAFELQRNEKALETLKLSILGDLPTDDISQRMNIDQAVMETAELLFFDIRDKRGATSWMTCHVFMPAVKCGSMELAAKMKVAFFGGPVMANAVLDAQEHLPFDEAQRVVDQEVLLHGKLQAALEFKLNEATAPQFLKTYLDYDLARQKLAFAQEKFKHKCEVSQRKHEAGLQSKRQVADDKGSAARPEPQDDVTRSNDDVLKTVQLVA
ncbi:MAG: hypothetical protein H6822_08640 [Planctomycetaceae bacterium]|nr:hypothetical protein [Planctomycetales bacterium]MCB9922236.1 hypothetical protein [Planctomycetaceae bacterium]